MLGQAWCQHLLGQLISFTQSPAESQKWLEEAKTRFTTLKVSSGLSKTLKYLSIAHLRQGEYENALLYANQQHDLALANNDAGGASEANMNLAWVYSEQGKFDIALSYLNTALKINQDIGNEYGVLAAYSDIAGIYNAQRNYPDALNFCGKALEIALRMGFLQGINMIVHNMGEIYRLERDDENALICYTQALATCLQLNDRTSIFPAIGNIGITYTQQGRYIEASPLFDYAIQQAEELNAPFHLCEFLYHKADHLCQQKFYSQSVIANDHALTIANEVQRPDIQFHAQVLKIHLQIALKEIDGYTAITQLGEMLNEWQDENQQAFIHYTIWKLDPSQESSRQQAAALYHDLHSQTPSMEFRKRYEELTGKILASDSQLPLLPESILIQDTKLEDLLKTLIG
jgi:tetratricopeptide (TPR) repeat protein